MIVVKVRGRGTLSNNNSLEGLEVPIGNSKMLIQAALLLSSTVILVSPDVLSLNPTRNSTYWNVINMTCQDCALLEYCVGIENALYLRNGDVIPGNGWFVVDRSSEGQFTCSDKMGSYSYPPLEIVGEFLSFILVRMLVCPVIQQVF